MSERQKHAFQAEVKELLGLMIHSLYSHKEIFLRELVSNSGDALDKLRFEALTKPEMTADGAALTIRLDLDREARRLRVIDTGIGMSRAEVVENLGTIARSGTRKFLEALRAKGESTPELIGQFGVGFYASFMVASEIEVTTRRADATQGVRWTSKGDGEFEIEDLDGLPRGTAITLTLRASAGDEDDAQDFCDPDTLRGLVRKYSDFVEWPIEMSAAFFEGDGSLARSTGADGVEVVKLNSQRPLWARSKDEITPEEYAAFYRHLTHDFSAPLESVHFKAEGTSEYTALLFIPSERPFDMFEPSRDRSRIALYVRKVFVMADCADLLPTWLRFVRGLVDSQDLPLNVSREVLQHNRSIAQIRKRLVRKTLDALGVMLAQRRADYERFWSAFGAVLKEGIVVERDEAQAVATLALFASSKQEGTSTLDEYLARMPAGQDVIYVLSGSEVESARRSPHLEALTARGGEALLCVDPIDEWVLEQLREFKGKKLVALERGDVDLSGEADKFDRENKEREFRAVLARLEGELSGQVKSVRFSHRLKDSPAVLVDAPDALGRHMERMLQHSGKPAPKRERILELNADHPLTQRLKHLHDADAASPRIKDWGELLLGQALLREGSPLPDPARFGQLVSELMLANTK